MNNNWEYFKDSSSLYYIHDRIEELEPEISRNMGNNEYNNGKYNNAITKWQGGLKYIFKLFCNSGDGGGGPELLTNKSLSDYDILLNSNISMAYLKLNNYNMCITYCNKVLNRRTQVNNKILIEKALYRKCISEYKLGNIDDSLNTMDDLLSNINNVNNKNAVYALNHEIRKANNIENKRNKRDMMKLFKRVEEDNNKRDNDDNNDDNNNVILWMDKDWSEEQLNIWMNNINRVNYHRSIAFTILYSIDILQKDNGVNIIKHDNNKLSIYIIGATSSFELKYIRALCLAELAIRLPKSITNINIILIGFNNNNDDNIINGNVIDEKTFDKGKRCIKVYTYKGLYHNVIHDYHNTNHNQEDDHHHHQLGGGGGGSCCADIVMLFNPLLDYYYDKWAPTIIQLINDNVPVVVVGQLSYPNNKSWDNEEIILKELGCNIVIPRRINPFPILIQQEQEGVLNMVKKNNHLCAFKGGCYSSKINKSKRFLLNDDDDIFYHKLNLIANDIYIPFNKDDNNNTIISHQSDINDQ